jgi:hypothetical protein
MRRWRAVRVAVIVGNRQHRPRGSPATLRRWPLLALSCLLGVLPALLHATDMPGHRAPGPRTAAAVLDQRVALLARELDLDARQQGQVRRILLQQKAEVTQAWSDESRSAPLRIEASRAISARTADRIRAILDDRQRERYIKPQPALAGGAQPAGKVESWISAVGNR